MHIIMPIRFASYDANYVHDDAYDNAWYDVHSGAYDDHCDPDDGACYDAYSETCAGDCANSDA